MNDLNFIVEFIFNTCSRIAGTITHNWILLLAFSVGLLRVIFEVFYKIKRKGGI